MKRLLQAWANAGLAAGMHAHARKYVSLSNRASLIVAAVGLFALTNVAVTRDAQMLFMALWQIFGSALVPVINGRGRHLVARVYFAVFSIALLVFGVHLMGR